MILVTGASGILGRVIVLELLKQGKRVRAAKRPASNIKDVKDSFAFYTENPDEYFNQIEWINVDFENTFSLQAALKDVTEVYHCAAKVSFHPSKEKEMFHTNIEGTRQLLAYCDGVKKFLFVSSVAVLDGANEEGFLDEDSDFNSKLEHSSYAISKHFSEMEVWRAAAEGLNAVIINPGVIIGSGNWNSSSGEMFKSFEKLPFAMSGTAAYVDVRDVAKIAVRLMDENVFGERFILVAENKPFLWVANFVRKRLGKPAVQQLSRSFLTVGYGLNLMLGWIIPVLKMASKINLDTVTSNKKISSKKIISHLNYRFIPVEESLDFHLENYKKSKK